MYVHCPQIPFKTLVEMSQMESGDSVCMTGKTWHLREAKLTYVKYFICTQFSTKHFHIFSYLIITLG